METQEVCSQKLFTKPFEKLRLKRLIKEEWFWVEK